MNDEWRDIPGFEGRYQVSSNGAVRSVIRKEPLIMKAKLSAKGYPTVGLYDRGRQRSWHVHRLVALAFHPDSWFTGAVVRHLDGNPANNAVANLAWGTPSENQIDRVQHGRHQHASKTRCANNHPFNEENTYFWQRPNGRTARSCRACNRRRSAEAAMARKAEKGKQQ